MSEPGPEGRQAGSGEGEQPVHGRRAAGAGRRKDELIARRAENGETVLYTRAEYGVRKDKSGPHGTVTSVGGLAFLALLTTSFFVVMVIFTIPLFAAEGWDGVGQVWWAYLAITFVAAACWLNFLKELRASRLRRAKGLARPVD